MFPQTYIEMRLHDLHRPHHYLFVYGTLMDPAVRLSVFGRNPQSIVDVLNGYRKRIVGSYPDIVLDSRGTVSGRVLCITDDELRTADGWEERYVRKPVTLESGRIAWSYFMKTF
jgi:gamma-glutamylcyclotransferase (GGCT)/AIG2-like uncharacterized protein YtfP